MATGLTTEAMLAGLKAAGESTRLRLIALLAQGELNVTDLTQILGQSQPRISRHLKLLAEAGLVERHREGSWVFFSLGQGEEAALARAVIERLSPEDATLKRDRDRADAVKRTRAEAAQVYFRVHAAEWDRIRALHVAEDQVEAAILAALDEEKFEVLLDFGTGTGRMLELFADRIVHGIGYDINPDMLAYARARLDARGLTHCHVRQGDLYGLDLGEGAADVVIVHQVLHFLTDPAAALREAARVLVPGGKLLVVDFAAHELEFLREEFAHQRLGFETEHLRRWLTAAGLELSEQRNLEPESARSDKQLTVSLWLATKPASHRADTERRPRPEMTV